MIKDYLAMLLVFVGMAMLYFLGRVLVALISYLT